MATCSEHFRHIAPRYRAVRRLDIRAVKRIAATVARRARWARRTSALRLLEIGTGTGRYLEAMMAELRRRGARLAPVLGVDASAAMLRRLLPHAHGRAQAVNAAAEALPLPAASVDIALSFNAVHHFGLDEFLAEAARVLRPDGLLVVYTRTPEQNRATVWGRHFPGFVDRETRLYPAGRLRAAVRRTRAFRAPLFRTAAWRQLTTLADLERQVRARHYSTFEYYTDDEFEDAVARFRESVRRAHPDRRTIPIQNNHLIVLAARRG